MNSNQFPDQPAERRDPGIVSISEKQRLDIRQERAYNPDMQFFTEVMK
jgi:hypothetical protein